MQGTSPFAYQSASFHSSSYLPRMEDQFMRDFACCGIVLPSLHDLLHHYEEQHASPTPIIPRRPSISANAAQQSSGNKNTMTDGFSSRDGQQRPQVQGQARSVVPPSALNGVQPSRFEQHGKSAGFQNDLSTVPDDEAVDAMDMDDEPLEYSQLQRFSGIDPPSGVFNQAPGVQYDYSNDRQYSETAQMTPTMNNLKGYRSPHITTPITPTQATMPFSRHHGTSSMNTTLSQRLPDLNRSGQQLTESDGLRYQAGPLVPFPNLFPLDTTTGPCIDEPGKHLNLSGLAPSHKHFAQLGITESQFMAAGGTEDWNFSGDEPKPFKCPVVGCEKAYKNQNGLKYHKQVSCIRPLWSWVIFANSSRVAWAQYTAAAQE